MGLKDKNLVICKYAKVLRNTCNECYLTIDIYLCKYNFPMIPFLILAEGAGKEHRLLAPGVGTGS